VNSWTHIAIWAVVIGAVFGYLWWQGQIQRLAGYVQETREELKKCSWSTWGELWNSTVLIIVATLLLGLFVVVVDAGMMGTMFSPLLQAILIVVATVIVTVKAKRQ
jgi:preprotein translocase SecE subunit